MELRQAFAKALRKTRKAHGLTQEDFCEVSSRTYLSSLERGQKSPTLEKIHALAEAMGVHPLTLLTLAYLNLEDNIQLDALENKIRIELNGIIKQEE